MSVEVERVPDPDGTPRVLLQLPDGFVLRMRAAEARAVAAALVTIAEDIEPLAGEGNPDGTA